MSFITFPSRLLSILRSRLRGHTSINLVVVQIHGTTRLRTRRFFRLQVYDALNLHSEMIEKDGVALCLNKRWRWVNMLEIVIYNTLIEAYQLKLEIYVAHDILLHRLCQLGKSMEALTFFYKIQDQDP
ncbi:hypothetical protein POM88_027361 [Heracleum sosnowskyi]|uniref:Uncharacterized protein n=1 Tax=Heracleum sosnowskyi TaxID=360622 RepID=A0AAD8I7G9_9APIA|nr:hypothetical protein POM88_027361 [Heracleum sosnowskyi]